MCLHVGPVKMDGWTDGQITLTGHILPPAVIKFKYWVNKKKKKKACGLTYFAALLKVSCL